MWRQLTLILIVVVIVGLIIHRALRPWHREVDHDHLRGAHGGGIISVAGDRYHVEAVFTREGAIKLYTLGEDEGRVLEVEEQELTAYVTAEGDLEAYTVRLLPEPQPGGAPGKTSCFTGIIPPGLRNKALVVVVPSLNIAGERFRLSLKRAGADMPQPVGEVEERDLFLIPKGAYTARDIEANGRMVPSRKYSGFQARHDHNPRVGDRLCPVTRTKANPACTWTIGGQAYEFCCPPCITEFVRLAREHPSQLEEPGAYVKR